MTHLILDNLGNNDDHSRDDRDDFERVIEGDQVTILSMTEKDQRYLLELVQKYSRVTVLAHLAIVMRSTAASAAAFTSRTGVTEGGVALECEMLSNEMAALALQTEVMSTSLPELTEAIIDTIEDGRFKNNC